MLADMTPEEMDKVEAAYRVHWERIGLNLQHLVMAMASMQGIEVSASQLEYLRYLDFED